MACHLPKRLSDFDRRLPARTDLPCQIRVRFRNCVRPLNARKERAESPYTGYIYYIYRWNVRPLLRRCASVDLPDYTCDTWVGRHSEVNPFGDR